MTEDYKKENCSQRSPLTISQKSREETAKITSHMYGEGERRRNIFQFLSRFPIYAQRMKSQGRKGGPAESLTDIACYIQENCFFWLQNAFGGREEIYEGEKILETILCSRTYVNSFENSVLSSK